MSAVLNGTGNIRLDTFAEYLATLGFEADITLCRLGEIQAARAERRAPRHVIVTLSDKDRTPQASAQTYRMLRTTPRHGSGASIEAGWKITNLQDLEAVQAGAGTGDAPEVLAVGHGIMAGYNR